MRLRVLLRPISTSFLLVTQWTCSDRNSLEVHPKQPDSPWRLTRLTPDEWNGTPRVTGKSPEPCCATHGVIISSLNLVECLTYPVERSTTSVPHIHQKVDSITMGSVSIKDAFVHEHSTLQGDDTRASHDDAEIAATALAGVEIE